MMVEEITQIEEGEGVTATRTTTSETIGLIVEVTIDEVTSPS
jgi:hypothetical protein